MKFGCLAAPSGRTREKQVVEEVKCTRTLTESPYERTTPSFTFTLIRPSETVKPLTTCLKYACVTPVLSSVYESLRSSNELLSES